VKKRFTEEQIIGFLKEADKGVSVKELCRKHGFSDASYYLWRSKYGGMEISDAKRLKALETENARLKKLLAESMLENEVTREALRKNGDRTSTSRAGAMDADAGIVGAQGSSDRGHERKRSALPAAA
jgi:putative transposase